MNIKIRIALFLFILSNTLIAQDTVKVKKPVSDDDTNCILLLCVKKNCFTDSISKGYFESDANIEVRINDDCKTKKKADVFVSAFELWTDANKTIQSSIAQSSFLTGPQKKIIKRLKPGDSFTLKNIVVHAPDGFKKMNDLQLILTK